MRKFNGVPKAHFGLFLKECEWRFNNSDPSVQLSQLRQWVILTGSTARRGAMAGIDITLAPLALYAYGIGRASKENVPDQ
jgi:hypothetical protein